jgi:AcrR family transcriptional regulator
MTTSAGLRADAERNRRQLVEAARAVFAERGLDASLDEIARRAGVGNATLYRRFPHRCLLLAAVFVDTLGAVVDAAARALADPDPWAGFVAHITFLCELQAGNRGLADLLAARVRGSAELEALRGEAFAALTALIDRAKASGDLRADFRHEDVVLILMANAGLIDRTGATAPAAWRRQLAYVLDGLRPSAAVSAAPTAPGRRQILRAMDALAERYGYQ